MSTKASIFLTNDNEHCYEECSDPVTKEGKFKGYKIVLELDKKNIDILMNDSDNLVIQINDPDSEIYKLIMLLKDKEEELRKIKP